MLNKCNAPKLLVTIHWKCVTRVWVICNSLIMCNAQKLFITI